MAKKKRAPRGTKRAKATKKKVVKKKIAKKKIARGAKKKTARKPAKKVVRRKAPVKKAPVKKAPVKKAPPKKVARPAAPPPPKAAPPPSFTPPPPIPVPEPTPQPYQGLFDTTASSEASEPPSTQPAPVAAALAVGDPAPDFELSDETGRLHRLSAYRGRAVVLYFYPKDDTPGCTTEACAFRDRLGDFTDRGAVVLGVSPDSAASHQRFAQKYGLTFPLLADEGHVVAERYGVWVRKVRHGAEAMGIARTTFVIGADGRIRHVFRNVRPEGHELEVLSRL